MLAGQCPVGSGDSQGRASSSRGGGWPAGGCISLTRLHGPGLPSCAPRPLLFPRCPSQTWAPRIQCDLIMQDSTKTQSSKVTAHIRARTRTLSSTCDALISARRQRPGRRPRCLADNPLRVGCGHGVPWGRRWPWGSVGMNVAVGLRGGERGRSVRRSRRSVRTSQADWVSSGRHGPELPGRHWPGLSPSPPAQEVRLCLVHARQRLLFTPPPLRPAPFPLVSRKSQSRTPRASGQASVRPGDGDPRR